MLAMTIALSSLSSVQISWAHLGINCQLDVLNGRQSPTPCRAPITHIHHPSDRSTSSANLPGCSKSLARHNTQCLGATTGSQYPSSIASTFTARLGTARLGTALTPPKTIKGHLRPFRAESESHAYVNVVTICTAYVPVGKTLICETVYLGSLESLRYCAKTGAAPEPPLLKQLGTVK